MFTHVDVMASKEIDADAGDRVTATAVVPYGRCTELDYRGPVTGPLELLRSEKVVRICAPMVRYSK